MFLRVLILCGLWLASFGSTARAELVFSISFTNQAQASLSTAQRALFVNAVNYWDSIIIGHRDNVPRTLNLSVDTFSQAGGPGGVLLGSGSYSSLGLSNVVPGAHTSDGRFYISTAGEVSFNVHPDAGALSEFLIRHEISHALGFGTLWELNQVYNDGITGNSFRTLAGGIPGQYVGAAALAAYRQEFLGQSAATFVPVELAGGNGTAHSHWNEMDNQGQSPTGIIDGLGRDFRDELLTGWASPTGNPFVSSTTIQSLFDIGFTVQQVPEPNGLIWAAAAFFFVRRRRSAV